MVRSVVSTFFTLLIPLAQSGTQLIIIPVLTGIGLGFALSAPFPIAADNAREAVESSQRG